MRGRVQRRLRLCHNSLFSCSLLHILFDIVSVQLAELKILILNRWRRWLHSSRVKLPFVSMSASCFLVSTYLTWILCGPGWFCQVTNQPQLSGFWIRVSLFDFCLWWSSWSPLHYLQKCKASHQIVKTSRLRKHNRHWQTQDRCAELESWFGCWCVFLMVCYVTLHSAHALGVPALDWMKNAILQELNPSDRERGFHPCANLHQEK